MWQEIEPILLIFAAAIILVRKIIFFGCPKDSHSIYPLWFGLSEANLLEEYLLYPKDWKSSSLLQMEQPSSPLGRRIIAPLYLYCSFVSNVLWWTQVFLVIQSTLFIRKCTPNNHDKASIPFLINSEQLQQLPCWKLHGQLFIHSVCCPFFEHHSMHFFSLTLVRPYTNSRTHFWIVVKTKLMDAASERMNLP